MATTVVTPSQSSDSGGNGAGFLVGAIILLLAVVLFFVYGLPYISRSMAPATSGTSVNIPDKMNVNVQHSNK